MDGWMDGWMDGMNGLTYTSMERKAQGEAFASGTAYASAGERMPII
jgi:hypothetical protein